MKKKSRILLLIAFIFSGTTHLMAQWIQTGGPEGGEAKCLTSIDTMLFVGTENGVFRSTDNGASWNPTGLKDEIIISLAKMPVGDSGMNLFAGTFRGVYLSTDNGNSWSDVNFGLGNDNIHTLAVKDTLLFAGTDDGVFFSPAYGAYWISVSTGLTNLSINTLTVIDTTLYAGTNEGLFNSTNNGTTWTPTGLTGETVRAIAAIDTNLFAGTNSSGVLRSTDMGANWDTVSIPGIDNWITSLAVINTDLFAGTGQGLYRTPSNGDYWIPVNTGLINQSILALHVMGTNLFAGTYGGVYGSSNNGANWTELNTGLKTTVVLSLCTSGDNLYAGTRNGVFRSNNSGNSWNLLASLWVCSIIVDGTNIYAGTGGHLAYSLNNGASWDLLHLSDSTHRVFSLAMMDSYIFAGAEGGGVHRIKHDAPGMWTILRTGQPDSIVNCLAVSGTDLFAGTWNGLYLSSDHGITWTAVNNGLTDLGVRALALKGSDLFAGTGGGVFRSSNNGASWTPVNNGLSGLALDVLSFAISGNNLFVGTWRGGVFLSRDNGASWTEVNTGLMKSDIHPSSVVHSLAIVGTNLYAGTRGVGVWRRPLSEMIFPELSAVDSVLYQSEFIEVTSTDEGIIYLVPEETNKDLTTIRGVCIDSVAAIANSAVNISLSGLDLGNYWLYSRDSSGNLSDPETFTIFMEIDLIAPELSAVDSVLYQSEFIEVTSTEDGIIYLVPEETNKDLTSIRGVCIDSVAAIANSAVNISLSGLDLGNYWLYARDSSRNISDFEAFTITGVGISNIPADQIRLFPNPTNDKITIQTKAPGDCLIEIFSMNGQIILSRNFLGISHQIDLSSFQDGVFYITVRSKDFVTTEKIIKLQ